MADQEISELDAASSLADADLFVIVQSGTSKKITKVNVLDLLGCAKAPSSTTEDKVPQWDSTSKLFKDGLTLATTVADPGSDVKLPTEQGVREAIEDVLDGTNSVLTGTLSSTVGAASAEVAFLLGTATEGLKIYVFDETISGLSAISTDMTGGIPTNSLVLATSINIETAIVAGSTSVRVGIGPATDPDMYLLAPEDFSQDTKGNDILKSSSVFDDGFVDVKVNMCTTGGAIGDTPASSGAVRVRIIYAQLDALDNA